MTILSKNLYLRHISTLFVLLAVCFFNNQALAADYSCMAKKSWVTSPDAPAEVPEGKKADFCQFYQFSWQWFLQHVSVSLTDASIRQFEDTSNFPILEKAASASDPTPNSCDDSVTEKVIYSSTFKFDEAVDIPERTGQAGTSGLGIYDQTGDVVFYDVRFSRNLCDAGTIQASAEFPSGTTEIKTAWKQLTSSDDPSKYFIMEANIDGVEGTETLGLIGFHQAIATTIHTEMIWASFEHVDNSPDCTNPAASDWSFASDACTSAPTSCTWNKAVIVKGTTGETPTEICIMHPYGTDASDPNHHKNITAISDLNTQIKGFLAGLHPSDPMSVFQNYFTIGALWVKNPSIGTDNSDGTPNINNQRGSLRLSNTVMETTFQDGSSTGTDHQYTSNCFGCHEYTQDQYYRNTGPHNAFDLSHIFIDDILAGQCPTTQDVEAGPIWSDKDAQAKCAATCSSHGGWKGAWTTTQPSVMSVCGCCSQ